MRSKAVHTALRVCFFVVLLMAMAFWAGPRPGLYGPPQADAAFPGTNGKIVFVGSRSPDYDYEIYVMNAQPGAPATRLTTTTGEDYAPDWSPDGSKIVFSSYRDVLSRQIYVMNADGSGQTRVSTSTDFDDVNPAWSPDGSKIAFASDRGSNYEIWVMNADGSGQTQLTSDTAMDVAPDWSRDGKIAFASYQDGDAEIWVMNADGSGKTKLTDNAKYDSSPDWSPDGSKIAFASNRDGTTYAEVYVMDAQPGAPATRLTTNTARDDMPAWSPDGTKIAFTSDRDGNSSVYVMDPQPGAPATRLISEGFNAYPDWQPSGYPPAGAFLFQLDVANLAQSLAMGDVNNDGYADIVIGVPQDAGGQGQVYVFSGLDRSLLYSFTSLFPTVGDNAAFGRSVAVGKVDGDLFADIIVGAPYEDVTPGGREGRVYVFSGATGAPLYTFTIPGGPNPGDIPSFGWSVAVGDVNQDGFGDVAVGARTQDGAFADQGLVYIFNGSNGAPMGGPLVSVSPQAGAGFGYSVAVGDIASAPPAEVIVGAPGQDVSGQADAGQVEVFFCAGSCPPQSLVPLPIPFSAPPPQAGANFGASVALGDVNGDSKADIAVGAPLEDVNGLPDQGRAYVYTFSPPQCCSLLFPLNSGTAQPSAQFGNSVAVGDVNGDPFGDIVVGAPLEDAGSPQRGRAYVFSGPSGSLVLALNHPGPLGWPSALFGWSLAVGDVNADSNAEIAVGAVGHIYVFSAGYPLAGADVMLVALHLDHLWLDVDHNGSLETDAGPVTFAGQGLFQRNSPYLGEDGHWAIQTTIASMHLTGMVLGFPVNLKAGGPGFPPSPGLIREQIAGTWYPADTYFDVVFEVQTADPRFGVMRNCDGDGPLHLQGVSMTVPATNVKFTVPGDLIRVCEAVPPPSPSFTRHVGGGFTIHVGDGTGTWTSGNPAAVGGTAEWPYAAAGADTVADASGGSGFNYTALGAALAAAAVALAGGAWLARRRWAR